MDLVKCFFVKMHYQRRLAGFTRVEIMIVVAIAGPLASIAITPAHDLPDCYW